MNSIEPKHKLEAFVFSFCYVFDFIQSVVTDLGLVIGIPKARSQTICDIMPMVLDMHIKNHGHDIADGLGASFRDTNNKT